MLILGAGGEKHNKTSAWYIYILLEPKIKNSYQNLEFNIWTLSRFKDPLNLSSKAASSGVTGGEVVWKRQVAECPQRLSTGTKEARKKVKKRKILKKMRKKWQREGEK